MNKILLKIKKLINFIRFGEVEFVTKEIINGITAEYAVVSKRTGKVVGYWAYGYYDPSLPYKD